MCVFTGGAVWLNSVLGVAGSAVAAKSMVPNMSTPAAPAASAPAANPTASAATPDVTASVQAQRRVTAARAGFSSTVVNQGGSAGMGVSQNNLLAPTLAGNIGTKRSLGS